MSSIADFNYIKIERKSLLSIVLLSTYLWVFGTIFELYDLEKCTKIQRVITGVIFTTSVTVVAFILTPFITPILPKNRLQIVFFYLSILVALFLCRLIYTTLIVSPIFFKNVLILGAIPDLNKISKLFKKSDPNYNIVGVISNREASNSFPYYKPEDIEHVVKTHNVTEILIANYDFNASETKIQKIFTELLKQGITIKEYTEVYETITKSIPIQFTQDYFYRYLLFTTNTKNRLYLFFYRLFEISIAAIGLLVGTFILPIILLGNFLGNRGPLFYTQEREGKNGKLFKIIKLRTMIKNAEVDNTAIWAKKNDLRITSFGKILRQSRIDEIPQFINILKGDMSLIGPRPERPYFIKELSKIFPFYETRHIIKPGLTGLAQVKTRYASSVDSNLVKLQYDLYYIKHKNIFLDIDILIKTLSTVVFFRGQ